MLCVVLCIGDIVMLADFLVIIDEAYGQGLYCTLGIQPCHFTGPTNFIEGHGFPVVSSARLRWFDLGLRWVFGALTFG